MPLILTIIKESTMTTLALNNQNELTKAHAVKASTTAKRLVNTKNLSHDEWLKIRKQGIGSSDAAAACLWNTILCLSFLFHKIRTIVIFIYLLFTLGLM